MDSTEPGLSSPPCCCQNQGEPPAGPHDVLKKAASSSRRKASTETALHPDCGALPPQLPSALPAREASGATLQPQDVGIPR